MDFYSKFIDWLDRKLKHNKVLCILLGNFIIIISTYLAFAMDTHSFKNTILSVYTLFNK